MEPDFTTLVIHNIDPMFAISVQTELLMEKHIDQCRMFIFPTPLHYGGCCYLLDILRKKIVVIDPQAGPFGFTTDRVKFHEKISHAIHGAFFRCVEAFFSSWPYTYDGWTREFPILMVEKITSDQSGIYSLFMASQYDGDTLRSPTTKENICSYRLATLQDVLKLEDNNSDAPQKAMQHIRASIRSL